MNPMAITALACLHWVLSGEILDLPWLAGIQLVALLRGAIIPGFEAVPGRFDLPTRERAFVRSCRCPCSGRCLRPWCFPGRGTT